MSMLKDRLWVAKYAPSNFDETIMPHSMKNKMLEYIETKNIPNLGVFGPAGTGKTSSMRALLNQLEVDSGDIMFINASDINSVDAVRNIIKPFAMSMSINQELPIRFVFLDECLSENEKVRFGTVDDWIGIALKDLKPNTDYPIISINMETGELENDIGNIISDKDDNIYEVELEDGRIIELNSKHPFLVKDHNGKIIEKTIDDGLLVGDLIITLNDNI